MMLTRYLFREARRRPGRTLLTLLGIVIGVQALVAIPITIESTRFAHRQMFEGLAGKAALEVVPCGEGGFAPSLTRGLEAVDAVVNAVPVIQSTAVMAARRGVVPIMTLGIDARHGDLARSYRFKSGDRLTGDGQVLLEDGFARSHGIKLGGFVHLLTPSGAAELRVTGLLEPLGAAAVNAGAVAVMPLETSQRLYRLEGRVNCLNLVLADGADADEVAADVAKWLPPGLTVQQPAARALLSQESLASTEKTLSILSIVSLVAGAFVILNSFLMTISERRRALAILRALGATRRQVTRLLFSESAALGVVGTLVGIPLGLAVSTVMVRMMAKLAGPGIHSLHLTAGPFLLAGVAGPGVAMLATFLPARIAGRRPPLAELNVQRGTSPTEKLRALRWPSLLGSGLLAFSGLIYAMIVTGRFPDKVYMVLLPCLLVVILAGAALVLPLVLSPLSRLVGWLFGPFLGIEGRLAVRQLRRHPTRTTLVVGVLMISVVLSTGFGNAILNSVRDVKSWNARIFTDVDYLVVPTALTSVGIIPVSMPREYADRIRALEGVERVGKGDMFSTRAAGRPITVFSRTCASGETPGFRFVDRDAGKVLDALRRGEVAVGTTLARRSGLERGDRIPIETRDGPRDFTIAALMSDYTAGGMIVLFEWDHARRFFDMEGAQYLYVTAAPEDRTGVDRRLRAFCTDHNLIVHSAAGFSATIDEMLDGMIGSFWVLLALVFLVASLGITNFLTMHVLEQTRELGVLRAVAMKRRQILKMVVSEALAIGLVAAIPGALLGVVLSIAMSHANYQVVGVRIPYVLESTMLLGCVAMALVVAVLAALPPAYRASRLRIIHALQHE